MVEEMMMSDIRVESALCVGCGQCLKVCPNSCFMLEHGISQVAHMQCMACGHCLAACPAGAITVEGIDLDLGLQTFVERSGVMAPGTGDLAGLVQVMRSRRSVRNYKEQSVALDILQDLVKIGTTAPSGTNCQLWTFAILDRRADVVALGNGVAHFFQKLNRKARNPVWRGLARVFAGDRLGRYYRQHYKTVQRGLAAWFDRGEDHLFHGAPAVILVGGSTKASCPAEDALLATGQILLAAQQMGLGTCLIGFVVEALKHDHVLRRGVGLSEDEEIYAVIALGYADEEYQQPAPRKVVVPRMVRMAG